jgi:hypothetical protein
MKGELLTYERMIDIQVVNIGFSFFSEFHQFSVSLAIIDLLIRENPPKNSEQQTTTNKHHGHKYDK